MQSADHTISNSYAADESILIHDLRDRYRCPSSFLRFQLSNDLSPDPRYFQFGADTICYGHAVKTAQQEIGTSDSDLLSKVLIDETHMVLPFNPNEVINNLRLERYPTSRLGEFERILKRIYYWLRPVTSLSLRKYVQKIRAANWQKREFPRWPVDTTVENICENLLLLTLQASGVDRIPFIWFWPNGARGCVAITHDVETVAGRDFCDQLMDIDDSYGIKASFQIVPEDRYTVTQEYLSRIRERGFEPCVQDLNHDGRLFDHREEFLRRVAHINRYGREYGAKGYRSGVLYRKPEWYRDLDFSFDMSIPNVAHLDPQRGGCCTVMPYFIGDVLELPLTTIQDYTLFHVLNERSIDLWRTQIEIILGKNGLASFIIHPDYIIDPETQAVYKELLSMLRELHEKEGIWIALPRDIDSWWRTRSSMSIVKDNESWKIVGEGAERAALAFAKLVNGKLVYELADLPAGEP